MIAFNFLFYLIFDVNRQARKDGLPESIVALIIFILEFTFYMIFVSCTISQICQFLDIYCLTIKQKKKA